LFLGFVLATSTAACSHDGRKMQSPNNEQVASTQTTAPPATSVSKSDAVAGTLPPETPAMTLTAPWVEGDTVGEPYTCAGPEAAPPLQWANVPAGTISLAIVLTDEDAPDYVHWVVANISPINLLLEPGRSASGAIEATNSAGTVGFTGPCPPKGVVHEYTLTLYALDQMLEFDNGADGRALQEAIYAAAIEATSVTFNS